MGSLQQKNNGHHKGISIGTMPPPPPTREFLRKGTIERTMRYPTITVREDVCTVVTQRCAAPYHFHRQFWHTMHALVLGRIRPLFCGQGSRSIKSFNPLFFKRKTDLSIFKPLLIKRSICFSGSSKVEKWTCPKRSIGFFGLWET